MELDTFFNPKTKRIFTANRATRKGCTICFRGLGAYRQLAAAPAPRTDAMAVATAAMIFKISLILFVFIFNSQFSARRLRRFAYKEFSILNYPSPPVEACCA